MSHKCSCFLTNIEGYLVPFEHVKDFPMLSHTEAAEGMIIKVDALLWRSHYDWFWPDEGWEASLSVYLTHMSWRKTKLTMYLGT